MEDFVRIKHAFNVGDAINVLAGLRKFYINTGKKTVFYQVKNFPSFYYPDQINSTVNDGQSVCVNDCLFDMMKPLFEAQEYIHEFKEWKGEDVDFNFDLTKDSRSAPMPYGLIHVWNEIIFPELTADLSVSWVMVEEQSIKKDYYKDKIIINRTQRYTNPYISYYFLKEHESRMLFSGTEAEHQDFCAKWDLQIEHLKVDNFYHLAQVIKWCKFGIYNQSMNFHLANSMHTPRILELCHIFPNTFAYGKNGFHSAHQSSMEYHFNQLLRK